MTRKNAFVVLTIASGLVFGAACQRNAAREEEQAQEAQRDAVKTTVEAQREANQDSVAAQGKANEAQRNANEDIARAQETAREKADKAATNAREETHEAVQALTKQRDDYRDKAQRELDDLTRSLADLKANAAKESGEVRTRLNSDIRELEARRADVARDIATLNNAGTSAELERIANLLDKRMEDLRDSLHAAEKKI